MSRGWDDAERILAVRLDAMGDVLMTTPAFRAIRAARPHCHLTLLTSPAGAAIAELIPEIDETIVYEAPWMKAGSGHSPDADLDMIDRLRRGAFDAAIVFTVFSQNPLPAVMICHLAGIRLILAHCRERAYRLLSDAVDDPEPGGGTRHEPRRQLDLVATRGWRSADERLSLTVDGERREEIRRRFASLRPWALIHPGASAASRRYPPAHFGAVARILSERGVRSVVAAGPGEEALAGAIAASAPGVTVIRPETLPDLVALIAAAPVMIANNSGPAHIAAATGTPLVSLYAATNPQHTPWMVEARVLTAAVPCADCFKSVCPEGHGRCLSDISPVAVADACCALLAKDCLTCVKAGQFPGNVVRHRALTRGIKGDCVMGLFTKDIETLHDLFVHQLQDIYYAENQITKALPKMIEKATSPELKQGFETHLRETEGQIARLEQAFQSIDEKPKAVTCPAIDGIIKEANEVAGEIADKSVLDAALIAAAQAVEHYEITRYGTLIAWGQQMGHDRAVSLFRETLEEEKATDEKLTQLAEQKANAKAEAAA